MYEGGSVAQRVLGCEQRVCGCLPRALERGRLALGVRGSLAGLLEGVASFGEVGGGLHGEVCRQLLLADRAWIAGSASLGEVGDCVGVPQRGQLPLAFAYSLLRFADGVLGILVFLGGLGGTQLGCVHLIAAGVVRVERLAKTDPVGFKRFCGCLL